MRKIWSAFRLIVWIGTALAFLGLGIWIEYYGIRHHWSIWQLVVLGIVSLAGCILTFKSIKIIKPDEMAVFVWLGEAVGFRDSGPCFIWWPFGELKIYSRKAFAIDFEREKVMCSAGEYREKSYGAQEVLVNAAVYLNFPSELRKKSNGEPIDDETHPLIKIYRNGIPTDEEGLKNWVKNAMLGAIRAGLGKMTWQEAVENLKKVEENIMEIILAPDEPHHPLIAVGFAKKGIKLAISEILLPDDLRKKLQQYDMQRIEAEAADFEAKQRAKETIGAIIRMLSEAYGLEAKEIQDRILASDQLRNQFLKLIQDLIKRQMSLNGKALTDIRIEGNGSGGDLSNLSSVLASFLANWQKEFRPQKEEGKSSKSSRGEPVTKEEAEEIFNAAFEEK